MFVVPLYLFRQLAILFNTNMKKLLKIGFTISVILVLVLLLSDFLSTQYKANMLSLNPFEFSTESDYRDIEVEIPDIFKVDLRRPPDEQEEMDDRILTQWKWVVNLSESSYMAKAKRKRLLVTTQYNGGYWLDDYDRNFVCHAEGVNLSRFCEVVEDRWQNPTYTNYDEVDAVFARRDWLYQFYEPRIPPSKISVFSIMESPYTVPQGDFSVNHPMLASFWRGSDIVTPYYKWVPYYDPPKHPPPSPGRNYATGKSKLVSIVVSHCPTANDRIVYVEELQKHIPVDVYGRCGPLKCAPKHDTKQTTCFDMIEETYKFYLAFENANCRDYITEKFFINSLQRNIVPIVYGAHQNDYKYASPPHSYIHVEDFPSPKELAEFLLRVDQNDTMYNEYFKWKGSGQFIHGGKDLFCRVCAMLFYTDFHPLRKWPRDSRWSSVSKCLPPGKMYWQR